MERGIAMMQEQYGSQATDMVAAVGPGIGPCCYTVGEEVWSEFGRQFGYAKELFVRPTDSAEVRLNLWEANRHQLLDAGVTEARITVMGECTACARSQSGALRYFSHRAEHGIAGRMIPSSSMTSGDLLRLPLVLQGRFPHPMTGLGFRAPVRLTTFCCNKNLHPCSWVCNIPRL